MDDGWRKVEAGACSAWPLPADATCAGVARQLFRRTASALALDTEAIDDGVTIVSELAANTLHAKCGQHSTGTCSIGKANGHGRCQGSRADRAAGEGAGGVSAPGDSPPGGPELWLYLRGSGEHCELVCKVFDTCPGWTHGAPGADGHRVPAEAISGRGLEVVHELSHGRWGYHLTRARLGGWSVRGKAVWFATPAPFARKAMPGLPGGWDGTGGIPRQAPRGRARDAFPLVPASEAMALVEAGLADRGFGGTTVRADDPAADTATLSVCGELTVWCRAGCAWLRVLGLDGQACGYGDLVEVAEQAVAVHETFCVDADIDADVDAGLDADLAGGEPDSEPDSEPDGEPARVLA